MKSNTKQVRDAVKNLIIEKGANNILNRHMLDRKLKAINQNVKGKMD